MLIQRRHRKGPFARGHKLFTCLPIALFSAVLPAQAQNILVQNGQTVTTTQTINLDSSVWWIEQGGAINVTGLTAGVNILASDVLLQNFGTITASGTFARGIADQFGVAPSNSIFNNGTITVIGDRVTGVLSGSNGGSTTNSGTIIADGPDGTAVAVLASDYGVLNTGTLIGRNGSSAFSASNDRVLLVNGGLVTADNGFTVAAFLEPQGVVLNGGRIVAGPGTDAIDFYAPDAIRGTVDNAGLIIAPLDRYAVRFTADDSPDIIRIQSGSIIQGMLDFATGSDRFIVERGLSIDYTFEAGGVPETVEANGARTWLIGNRVVIVDPSAIQLGRNLAPEIAGSVLNTVGERLAKSGAGGDPATHGIWFRPFGSFTESDIAGSSATGEATVGGALFGADAMVSDRIHGGLFGGIAYSDWSPQTGLGGSATTGFGGAFAKFGDRVSLAAVAGNAPTAYRRTMLNNTVLGGIETIDKNMGGWFVAPEVSVNGPVFTIQGRGVRPSLRGRAVFARSDGSQDSESGVNITVDSSSTTTLEARAQLAIDVFRTSMTLAELRLGLDARSVSGGDNEAVNIAGQVVPVSAAPRESSGFGGFIGGRVEHAVGDAISLFLATEIGVMTDTSFSGSARGGVRVAF